MATASYKRETRNRFNNYYLYLFNKFKDITTRKVDVFETLRGESSYFESFKQKLLEFIDKGFPVDYRPTKAHPTLLLHSVGLTVGNNVRFISSQIRTIIPAHAQIIRYLIEEGADINALNRRGDNALMLAIARAGVFTQTQDGLEIIEYLIKNTSDINHVNFDGVSALDIAIQLKIVSNTRDTKTITDCVLIKELLEAGAGILPNIYKLLDNWEEFKVYTVNVTTVRNYLKMHSMQKQQMESTDLINFEYKL